MFVIYSAEDPAGKTILYEIKGENAKLELNILIDLLEGEENGESINGKPSFTQRVSEGSWLQYENGVRNHIPSLGGGTNNQNAGILQRQSRRNPSRAFCNVIDNLFAKRGEVIPRLDKQYSLEDLENYGEKNSNEDYLNYSEKDYHDFGWARANGILNEGQNADYRSKFADATSGRATFNKSKNGEYIIPVSDIYDSLFEGVNNVLVFAKGTIDSPIITSVIEIYEYDETNLDRIRRRIYDSERRGIQQKTGKLFGRYYAFDFEFRPNQQRAGFGSVGNSSDDGYGRRSSGETASIKEREKIDYSLEDNEEVPSKKTKVFLNAIDDLRSGKRNATDNLSKYVDSGMISTEDYDSLIKRFNVITEAKVKRPMML